MSTTPTIFSTEFRERLSEIESMIERIKDRNKGKNLEKSYSQEEVDRLPAI